MAISLIWRSGWLQWSAWASNTVLWFHSPWEENIIKARNWKNGALFYWSAKFIGTKYSGMPLLQSSSNLSNKINSIQLHIQLHSILYQIFCLQKTLWTLRIQYVPAKSIHFCNFGFNANYGCIVSSNCGVIFDILSCIHKKNTFIQKISPS